MSAHKDNRQCVDPLSATGTPLADIDVNGRRWHIVVVKPLVQAGPMAVKALQARGWQVLRPMCRELVMQKGQKVEAERCMFGRYVFAGAGPAHEAHALRFVPGVQYPVNDARRRPLVLRPDVLEAVVARLAKDGGVADFVPREPVPQQFEAVPQFEPGQAVRVLEGPFKGFTGLFEGDENQRVRVLVSLFGRQTTARVSRRGIEAAG
ncbi:transcription termination/antitermination protein NusG [Azospirillum argentinense]